MPASASSSRGAVLGVGDDEAGRGAWRGRCRGRTATPPRAGYHAGCCSGMRSWTEVTSGARLGVAVHGWRAWSRSGRPNAASTLGRPTVAQAMATSFRGPGCWCLATPGGSHGAAARLSCGAERVAVGAAAGQAAHQLDVVAADAGRLRIGDAVREQRDADPAGVSPGRHTRCAIDSTKPSGVNRGSDTEREGAIAQRRRQPVVGEDALEGGRQAGGILRRHEETGLAVDHDVAHATDVGGDHRDAHRHGLEDGQRQDLGALAGRLHVAAAPFDHGLGPVDVAGQLEGAAHAAARRPAPPASRASARTRPAPGPARWPRAAGTVCRRRARASMRTSRPLSGWSRAEVTMSGSAASATGCGASGLRADGVGDRAQRPSAAQVGHLPHDGERREDHLVGEAGPDPVERAADGRWRARARSTRAPMIRAGTAASSSPRWSITFTTSGRGPAQLASESQPPAREAEHRDGGVPPRGGPPVAVERRRARGSTVAGTSSASSSSTKGPGPGTITSHVPPVGREPRGHEVVDALRAAIGVRVGVEQHGSPPRTDRMRGVEWARHHGGMLGPCGCRRSGAPRARDSSTLCGSPGGPVPRRCGRGALRSGVAIVMLYRPTLRHQADRHRPGGRAWWWWSLADPRSH